MKKNLLLWILIFAALVSGVLLSPWLRIAQAAFQGVTHTRCYMGVCTGDSEAAALRQLAAYPATSGGLEAVVCVRSEFQEDILFFPRFLNERCQYEDYIYFFSDGTKRTMIRISGNRVMSIRVMPVRNFDL